MPILDAHTLELFSRSPEQTRRLGMRLGALMRPGDVVCLQGDLGTGKTTLVQGIARGWGSLDPVSSPTFVLINVYRRPEGRMLFHLDAYRLNSLEEAIDLDIDALLSEGALVIEWPERIDPILPPERLWVTLTWISEEQRGLLFNPIGARYRYLVQRLRQQVLGVAHAVGR
ncbi:tRNA (adenosine(37)-N6)-threonylcarbamoyltransferase complex ATPase subunit type 1 TsaE [uncultured Thermanaerothrix sp.]|uniref:tRNA (adenosine(37)-N6)-threonylcarbamoyltransferase complex ATPase subunit type 1 TsaE n=1 Tax=uncultured Thermanaerothrix sp. TaxID=1195149 RepID=UPI0026189E3A|nr:tRNA (adenosine(37)-N6)-threonylcarbamoyltransferase complex ATPase subunit type 1 TsaE [uncultured Thermanaerothrix sp.]